MHRPEADHRNFSYVGPKMATDEIGGIYGSLWTCREL